MTLIAALLGAISLFSLGPLGDIEADAGVQAGSRLRVVDEQERPGQGTSSQDRRVGEFDLGPRLTLTNDARLRLALTYAPTLHVPMELAPAETPEGQTLSQVEGATYLHNAELRAERPLGRWVLRGSAGASYGSLDPLASGALPGQPLVGTARIPYRALTLSAGVTLTPSSRTLVSLDAGASSSGGDGTVAEQSLPTQRDLRVDGAFDLRATRRDTYGALLSFAGARVQRGSDSVALRAGGSWTRGLTPRHSLRLSGGAAVAREQSLGGDNPGVLPWAEGSLAYSPGERRPTLAVTLGAQPAIDRLTGAVDVRGFVEARSAWAPARDWAFGVSGQAAVLEPWLGYQGQEVSRTWTGGVGIRMDRSLGRFLTAGAGVFSTWQRSGREDLATFREVVAMLDLVATLSPR